MNAKGSQFGLAANKTAIPEAAGRRKERRSKAIHTQKQFGSPPAGRRVSDGPLPSKSAAFSAGPPSAATEQSSALSQASVDTITPPILSALTPLGGAVASQGTEQHRSPGAGKGQHAPASVATKALFTEHNQKAINKLQGATMAASLVMLSFPRRNMHRGPCVVESAKEIHGVSPTTNSVLGTALKAALEQEASAQEAKASDWKLSASELAAVRAKLVGGPFALCGVCSTDGTKCTTFILDQAGLCDWKGVKRSQARLAACERHTGAWVPLRVPHENTEKLLTSKKDADGDDERLLKAYLEQLLASLQRWGAPRSLLDRAVQVAHMRAHGFLPLTDAGAATDSEDDGNDTDDTVPAAGANKTATAAAVSDESDSTTEPEAEQSEAKGAAKAAAGGVDAIDLVSDSSDASSDSVVVQGHTNGASATGSVTIRRGDGRHPLPAKLGSVPVSNWDAECLEAGEYLNDSIIDWALKFRLLRGVDEGVRGRVHIMSSLFLKELRSHVDDSLDSLPPVQRYAAGYRQVAKWTRKVDIFKKDFIIIPVNDSLHWSLIVVCYPASYAAHAKVWSASIKSQSAPTPNYIQALQAVNSSSDATSYPFLLMMDSLAAHDVRETCDSVRAWLAWEFAARHPDSLGPVPEDSLTRSGLLPHFNVKVPRQTNSFDCGVFVICYAEMVLQAVQHNRIEAPFLRAGSGIDIDILRILPKMLDYTFGRGTFQACHVSRVRGRLMAMVKRLQLKNAVLVYSVPRQSFETPDSHVDVLSDDIKLPDRRDATHFAQREVGAIAAAAASSSHIAAVTRHSGAQRGSVVKRLSDLSIPSSAEPPPRKLLPSPPLDLATSALPLDAAPAAEDSIGASSSAASAAGSAFRTKRGAAAATLVVADDAISVSSAGSTAAVEGGSAHTNPAKKGASTASGAASSSAAADIVSSDSDSIADSDTEGAHPPLQAPQVTRPAAKRPRRGAATASPPQRSIISGLFQVVKATILGTAADTGSAAPEGEAQSDGLSDEVEMGEVNEGSGSPAGGKHHGKRQRSKPNRHRRRRAKQ